MANPLFKHLPEDIVRHGTNLCGQLFDKVCCAKAIQDLDFQESRCISMFYTKILGYGIIVGASAVKLPQVLKIFGAKSGAGITVLGVILELLAITFNACYSLRNSFPFSAWGEAIFLALETALIAFLVLWYDGNRGRATTFLLTYGAIVFALTHPTIVPKDVMWYLQSTVVVLSVSGKMIQAVKNYKAQHTGQLSAVTAWAILAGAVTRIYTTIKETGDMLTAVTFVFAAAANAILALQVVYYWNSTKKFIEKGKKKKAN